MTADKPIYTAEAAPGDVALTLTYPTVTGPGIRDDDRNPAVLKVVDRTSGQTLVEVTMNSVQFLSFMSSTGTNVSGATLPKFPARIGQRRQNQSTSIPAVAHEDVDAAAQARADLYRAEGWIPSIRRTNYGRDVVAVRWIDAEGNPVP